MNAYEEKRANRIERMRRRADGKDAEAARLSADVQQMGEIMNGQPILVGHHSEKRHRRDFDRMHRKIGQSCDASDEAAALRSRARAAERSTAVSSDDPDAIEKLKQKIAGLETDRNAYKKINRACRAKDAATKLLALGYAQLTVDRLLTDDCFGNIGVPSYKLRNMGADIRRLKKRVAELEARADTGPREDETIGDVTIEEDAADNRVRILFPGKPPAEVRSFLKQNGFRWSPRAGAWQRHTSERAWYLAREAAGMLERVAS